MMVLGLTGSVGMGKSETVKMFRRLGVPVHDADAAVHKLTRKNGEAIPAIKALFPSVVSEAGVLDRKALGAIIFNDKPARQQLEAILHPMVQAIERRFIANAFKQKRKLVVLDIPLLFEIGAENRADLIVVVSAPAFIQEQRVLARPNMTPEKFAQIKAAQMPDVEKRARADIVLQTGAGRAATFREVRELVLKLTAEKTDTEDNARNRTGYRNNRHGSGAGAQDRRDRVHRGRKPAANGSHLP